MFKHRIISPERSRWVGKKKPDGCVFCRIAKDDPEVEEKTVYKDKDVMVLMNIFPYNTGHIQVIPVKHVESLEEMSDDEIKTLFSMVRKATLLLKKVLSPLGFNIGINQGLDVSGASVKHLHVHVVPRFRTDFGFLEIISGTKVFPEPLEKTFEKLKREAKMLK